MRVKNLQAWAGTDFSYLPGDEIELDDDVATARIEAGLCEALPGSEPSNKAKGKKPKASDEAPAE
jgi:hypothetical protein